MSTYASAGWATPNQPTNQLTNRPAQPHLTQALLAQPSLPIHHFLVEITATDDDTSSHPSPEKVLPEYVLHTPYQPQFNI